MADLTSDGKSLENKEPVKTKKTERKPISLDKPQETQQQIQVHQGNIGVLQVKFLESINNQHQQIIKLIERCVELMEKKHG